jgi:hypothetical protein
MRTRKLLSIEVLEHGAKASIRGRRAGRLRREAGPTTLSAAMRAPFLLLGPLALAVLAGCVSAPGDATADAEVSTPATAIVVVEGFSSNEGSRTDAVARFVRTRTGAVDDDALRMVGARVEFPAIGGCGPLGSARPAGSRAITLLDVGGVTLLAGNGGEPIATLEPRQLPDVADLVSGVVYSTAGRGGREDAFPSKSAYLLRVDGTAESEVPPFVVSVTSPGEPADVRVGGDDGRGGPVSIALGAPVDLRWEAGLPAPAGDADDLIYVDLSATSAAPSTRCLFLDSGQARLDESDFGALGEGTIAVHRLHREAFHARGVEPGEVRFDFARVVTFVRR